MIHAANGSSIASSIIVIPHENGFNWLVSGPNGSLRGFNTTSSEAWETAITARKQLNG